MKNEARRISRGLKKRILLFLPNLVLSCILSFHACQSYVNPTSNFFTYTDSAHKVVVFNAFLEQDSWRNFFTATFEFPVLLQHAANHNLSVVMLIPSTIKGFSPLENGKEWIEGTRVALTWASIYFRFKELGLSDVCIVCNDEIPSHDDTIRAIQAVLTTPITTQENAEQAIDHRFFNLASLLNNNPDLPRTYSLQPLVIEGHFEEPRLVQPLLNKQQPSHRRFLITGAAGFIGSHLSKALLNEGHQVIGVDNLLCCNMDNIKNLATHSDFFFVKHDVAKPLDIDGPIDFIVHLASVPSPEFYYRLPLETMTSGLHGTRNMLELALKKNAQFLFSSTSEVYGDPEKSPQDESYAGNVSPIGKRSQYDQSKRGAETLIKFYFDHYGLDVRIARIFNTYGPNMGLGDGRVVTNFIRAVLQQEPMKIHGQGMQTRSFSYVSDTVEGLMQLIHAQLPSTTSIQERVVNIGSNQEFTIIELARLINDLAPKFAVEPVAVEFITPIDATDPKQRRPNLKRAKKLLHYEPTISLESGLEKTMEYFLKKEGKELDEA